MTLEAYTGGHDEVLALRREQGRSLLSSPSFSRDTAYSHSPTASRAASLDEEGGCPDRPRALECHEQCEALVNRHAPRVR